MNLVALVLLLPLAGFLAALFVPRSSPGSSRVWALLLSLVTFACSIGLAFYFDRGISGEQFAVDAVWMQSPEIHFFISVNGVSLCLVLLTAFAVANSALRTAAQRRLSQVRAVARVAQSALLREVPATVAAGRMASRYISAAAEARVGGDVLEVGRASCRERVSLNV